MRLVKNTFNLLVIAFFLAYYGGASFFPHTHYYTWGKVTHSHPYLPSAHHTHSAASVHAIEHLTALFFLVFYAGIIPGAVFVGYARYFARTSSPGIIPVRINGLRAPPVL